MRWRERERRRDEERERKRERERKEGRDRKGIMSEREVDGGGRVRDV